MESTWRKLEEAIDFLCEKTFGKNAGVHISGEVYNMIFDEQYSLEDLVSFLEYCIKRNDSDVSTIFEDWFEEISKSHKK